MIEKIPYGGIYPSALKTLIEEGVVSIPRQRTVKFQYTTHVDIVYTLDLKAGEFRKYHQLLLQAAEQECTRYKKQYPKALFFGSVKVELHIHGRKERDFGIHTSETPEDFVWGPGYKVPQYHLEKAFEEILDIPKRYPGAHKVSPFRVKKLFISIYARAG